MRRFALLLSLIACGCASACQREPEPVTGGHCIETEPVLQVGIEKTRFCVGETAKVAASSSDGCAGSDVTAEVEWTSTAPKVVSVTQTGRITAMTPGQANVVAVRGKQTAGVRVIVAACP